MKKGSCGTGGCDSCAGGSATCKGCGSPCMPGHGSACSLWYAGKALSVLGVLAAILAAVMSWRGMTVLWMDDVLMYLNAIVLLLLAMLAKAGHKECKKRLMMKQMMDGGCCSGGSCGEGKGGCCGEDEPKH